MHPDTISFTFSGGNTSSHLASAIVDEMENIVRGIQFSAIKKIEDEQIVWKCRAEFKSKPVSHLNFEYFDGHSISESRICR